MGCYVCGRPCFGNEMTPTAHGLQQCCSDDCRAAVQMGDFINHKLDKRSEPDPHKYWYNKQHRFMLHAWIACRRPLSRCVVEQINGSVVVMRVYRKDGVYVEHTFSAEELLSLSFRWRDPVAKQIKLMRGMVL